MSFPNIPDINPDINVTKEDAVVLLLLSIALEEISLSSILDAEAEKIKFLVGECNSNASIQDLKDINRSVDRTIKDIIKLQMLLQFKLENVLEISPTSTTSTTSTSTSTSTSTTTTTTTRTTTTTTTTRTTTSTSTTSKSTTKCHKCKCSLTGRGQGIVSNYKDQFTEGIAVLQSCVCEKCKNIKDSLLCYSVQKEEVLKTFTAYPESLIIECPTVQEPYKVVIRGSGAIVKKVAGEHDVSDIASFVLTVWDAGTWSGADIFHIAIEANERPELNHDSGIVDVKGTGLVIGICHDS